MVHPFHLFQAKSDDQLASEKAWMSAEKVWLVHKGGFAGARLLKANRVAALPEGRCKVKLDHGGDVIEVDEDDVEKVSDKVSFSMIMFPPPPLKKRSSQVFKFSPIGGDIVFGTVLVSNGVHVWTCLYLKNRSTKSLQTFRDPSLWYLHESIRFW